MSSKKPKLLTSRGVTHKRTVNRNNYINPLFRQQNRYYYDPFSNNNSDNNNNNNEELPELATITRLNSVMPNPTKASKRNAQSRLTASSLKPSLGVTGQVAQTIGTKAKGRSEIVEPPVDILPSTIIPVRPSPRHIVEPALNSIPIIPERGTVYEQRNTGEQTFSRLHKGQASRHLNISTTRRPVPLQLSPSYSPRSPQTRQSEGIIRQPSAWRVETRGGKRRITGRRASRHARHRHGRRYRSRHTRR